MAGEDVCLHIKLIGARFSQPGKYCQSGDQHGEMSEIEKSELT